MRIETLPNTNAEIEVEFAKDLVKSSDDFEKITRECDALRAKVCKPRKRLAALCYEPEGNEMKREGLKLRVASVAKPIAPWI